VGGGGIHFFAVVSRPDSGLHVACPGGNNNTTLSTVLHTHTTHPLGGGGVAPQAKKGLFCALPPSLIKMGLPHFRPGNAGLGFRI
jgi:hypothetical protein